MPARSTFGVPARWAAATALALIAACAQPEAPPAGPDGGRAASETESLTLKGSDTMVQLGQRWAETYMAAQPGVSVQVVGGGSGTGISALINGTTQICQASRPMKDKEKAEVRARRGVEPVEVAVALDGLAVYVHEGNPVTQVSLPELKGLYRGETTGWKALNGTDRPVVLYGRENSSGTYEFFKEHVLDKEDFAPQVQTLPGTAAVADAVSRDSQGIGYGGVAYAKGIRLVPVSREKGGPAVAPTKENVEDGSYPLARKLYWYFAGEPTGAAAAFRDWVIGAEGQRVVTEVGYFPISGAAPAVPTMPSESGATAQEPVLAPTH